MTAQDSHTNSPIQSDSPKESSAMHRTPFFMRPLFWVILVLAVCLGAFITFMILHQNSQPAGSATPDSQSTLAPEPSTPTPSDEQDSVTTPDSSVDSDSSTASEPERIPQYEGVDPNQLTELTGSIAAQYVDYEQNLVIITATIDQYLSTAGTCTLTITRGSYTFFTGTATAAADVTTSGCGPFEIPLSSLPSSTYNINITISAGGKSGLITGELTI